MASKRAKFIRSRRNNCTVDIPVMFSCRNALIRAISPRTVRYESRTLRRNHWVTKKISGSTENATSASRQFIHSITAHDAGQREHVAEDGHHAGGEQIVQDVDVRGHPRHQPPDRIAVVVAQVEPLQMAVDRHPQVVHDPLPGQLQRPGLEVFGGERGDQHRQVERRQAVEAGELPPDDVAVDRDLDQVGLHQRRDGADDDGDEGEGDLPPVRAQRYCSRRRIRRASYAFAEHVVVR